jgi:transposase
MVTNSTPPLEVVAGIDVGSAQCVVALLHPDKTPIGKPSSFANSAAGFALLAEKLAALGPAPSHVWVGLEATGLYWENLYYFLAGQGYHLTLLHPGQTHHFADQRGLRAKTDRLDARTIARVLLSGDARPAYIPDEQVASYRELLRLHTNLRDEAARYKLQIRGLVTNLFPEFTQVFSDPTGPTARALLALWPSAAAWAQADPAQLTARLRELAPRRYGADTAERLVRAAQHSAASGVARAAREQSLRILLGRLSSAEADLAALEQAVAALVSNDPGLGELRTVPEFGPKTAAVLRAELGDVRRFRSADQAVAYLGLDVRVRQSGKWRGQAKLSKRGSGAARRLLFLAALRSVGQPGSAFGAYYRHLVSTGRTKMAALMAVMRKMVLVAYRLLKSGGRYDPTKVWAGVLTPLAALGTAPYPAPPAGS